MRTPLPPRKGTAKNARRAAPQNGKERHKFSLRRGFLWKAARTPLPQRGHKKAGDTLFCRSVGRTDFPGGDAGALRESLRTLFALSGDPEVYPGHDEQTSLEEERLHNPYAM